ncbi:MAG TPA: hypothetical protein VKS01_09815 [Bryobacteraceae bacterium]|nr:hypothetical protein [Bryobacteraceae bacterium]
MKHLGLITAACGALLLTALYPRNSFADEWDKKTDVRFSSSVHVPGMTLPAGEYVFRLLDSRSDRYIVQIFNPTEQHLFTTVLAIPSYRLKPTDKVLFTFYESPAGTAAPINTWWYPGDNYGREFVYKKGELAIATAAYQTPETTKPIEQPAEAPSQVAEAPAQAPEQPTAEPTPEAQEPAQTPQQPPAAEPAPAPAPETPSTLPTTGSEWPLTGLIGIGSLLGAAVVRAARKA